MISYWNIFKFRSLMIMKCEAKMTNLASELHPVDSSTHKLCVISTK